MTSSDEAKARVKQALFEGANARGFCGENAEVYEELLAEEGRYWPPGWRPRDWQPPPRPQDEESKAT